MQYLIDLKNNEVNKNNMKNFENSDTQENKKTPEQEELELKWSQYVEEKILLSEYSESEEEYEKLTERFKKMYTDMDLSDMEKANILGSSIINEIRDRRQGTQEENETKPSTRVKKRKAKNEARRRALWEDESVRETLLNKFVESRIDKKDFRKLDLKKELDVLNKELEEAKEEWHEIQLEIRQENFEDESVSYKKELHLESEELRTIIRDLEEERNEILSLGEEEATEEKTDFLAMVEYEKLLEYKEQLDKGGFVWTESRKEALRDLISQQESGRMPVLFGEAGSGKSAIAEAAAVEMTGQDPLMVACSKETSEYDLLKESAIDERGSFEKYGPVMQAFTGYSDSRQENPDTTTGRMVRLDEFNLLGDKSYALLKRLGQLKPGDLLEGKPVLPGAGLVLTANPEGPRYPNRRKIDVAMRRELGIVDLPYMDMNNENPEIYETMLAALMDENNNIIVDKSEVSPHYKEGELPEESREVVLIDNEGEEEKFNVLKEGKELEKDPTALDENGKPLHGALWRVSYAISDIQKSFVYGNSEVPPEDALKYSQDKDGNLEVSNHGSPLILDEQTITMGEVVKWMEQYKVRRESSGDEFQNLSEWIKEKAQAYLKQMGEQDKADYKKVKAIFDHYHLLDEIEVLENPELMTPKEIGYMSPNVPKPVELEKIIEKESEQIEGKKENHEAEVFETVEKMLDSGETVLVNENATAEFEVFDEAKTLNNGDTLELEDDEFKFVGIVSEGKHEGKLVFEIGDGLHKVIPKETIVDEEGNLENGEFGVEIQSLIPEVRRYLEIFSKAKELACRGQQEQE